MRSACSHVSPVPARADRATVLIVDNQPLIRLGLRALLEPDYEVVGEMQCGREVIDAIQRLRPAIVLLDLSLPDKSGMDTLRELAPNGPRPEVVALTTRLDVPLAEQVLRLGARAIIPKDA